MLICELTEAPLRDYEPLGDFSRTGGFRHAADRALEVALVLLLHGVERVGGAVATVSGDPRTMKITTRADLERAEELRGAD